MAGYGLRVRDDSGNVVLDTTDRITRLIVSGMATTGSSYRINSNWSSGIYGADATVQIPGLTDDGTWVVIVSLPGEWGYRPAIRTIVNNGNFVVTLMLDGSDSNSISNVTFYYSVFRL